MNYISQKETASLETYVFGIVCIYSLPI